LNNDDSDIMRTLTSACLSFQGTASQTASLVPSDGSHQTSASACSALRHTAPHSLLMATSTRTCARSENSKAGYRGKIASSGSSDDVEVGGHQGSARFGGGHNGCDDGGKDIRSCGGEGRGRQTLRRDDDCVEMDKTFVQSRGIYQVRVCECGYVYVCVCV